MELAENKQQIDLLFVEYLVHIVDKLKVYRGVKVDGIFGQRMVSI